MQRLQRRFGTEAVVAACTFAFGLAALVVAHTPDLWLGCLGMALAGFSWVIVPTNFNTSTQLAVPAWIKGRAMGMYVLVLWGAFAVGSAVFGRISNTYGYRGALNIAGISVLVGTVAILWLRLVPKNKEDFTPIKRDLPEPVNFSELQTGPLRATVNYDVRVDDQAAFAAMLPELRRRR
jgi:MFS family permease